MVGDRWFDARGAHANCIRPFGVTLGPYRTTTSCARRVRTRTIAHPSKLPDAIARIASGG